MLKVLTSFFHSKTAPGLVLCFSAVMAMIFQNSFLVEYYGVFKNLPILLEIGDFLIDKPLLLWINDGLMAIFFLLVGLEIKREIMEGHLSTKAQMVLPFVAALGGLVVPALAYWYINLGDPVTMRGWAIPAATDIAFALGVLMMLGDRIPQSLKVTLVAIAIIDDLAAIIIIALFYTTETSVVSLGLAGAGLSIAMVMNKMGIKRVGPYIILGLFIWASVLKSGVHATLAGVALGMIIPLKPDEKGYSPLKVLEHALHPWVAFFVIPIFAFANAGISLDGVSWQTLQNPVTLGITAGLFLGKQVGVMVFTFLARLVGFCQLPKDVSWLKYYGMAMLTGIGFTMSLFIGTLAFPQIEFAAPVRLGVMMGSFLSAVCGVALLLLSTKKPSHP